MKRTPIKRLGKVGNANREARGIIAEICKEKNLNHCEMQLEGCMGNWPLAPAHRHKRSWYQGDVEKLSDFYQWIVACQVCHDLQENDKELTEDIFSRLRGVE